MKKYEVQASYVTYCHAVIEAESEEEAYQIAKNMDGGSFDVDRQQGLGDWDIYSVDEIEENK
jgi:hypothetical protein